MKVEEIAEAVAKLPV
jgi:hypothetical protein